MKHAWMTLGVLFTMAGGVGAQESLEPAEDWHVRLGPVHKSYMDEHSALQRRADDRFESSADFREGSIEGRGWGFRVIAEKGGGAAHVTYLKTDYTYALDKRPDGSHDIDTDRRDVDAHWRQESGSNQKAVWGWMAGFRYIGLDEHIWIAEASAAMEKTGTVNWYLVNAGYFGEIHPFGGEYLIAHGSISALIGEVSGLARTGTDSEYNSKIEEVYDEEYSIAYGASVVLGASLALTGSIHLGLEYNREWLYSFQATDSGVIVFPDNNDAHFIENHQGLSAFVQWVF